MHGSEQENTRILHELLDAWAREDLETLLNGFVDDVEWFVLGPTEILPWAGMHRGREGWLRWRSLLSADVKYSQFETLRFVAAGDTIVQLIFAKGVAKGTGRLYESHIARVWTFRQGKVARVESYFDTYAYVRAIGRA